MSQNRKIWCSLFTNPKLGNWKSELMVLLIGKHTRNRNIDMFVFEHIGKRKDYEMKRRIDETTLTKLKFYRFSVENRKYELWLLFIWKDQTFEIGTFTNYVLCPIMNAICPMFSNKIHPMFQFPIPQFQLATFSVSKFWSFQINKCRCS